MQLSFVKLYSKKLHGPMCMDPLVVSPIHSCPVWLCHVPIMHDTYAHTFVVMRGALPWGRSSGFKASSITGINVHFHWNHDWEVGRYWIFWFQSLPQFPSARPPPSWHVYLFDLYARYLALRPLWQCTIVQIQRSEQKNQISEAKWK